MTKQVPSAEERDPCVTVVSIDCIFLTQNPDYCYKNFLNPIKCCRGMQTKWEENLIKQTAKVYIAMSTHKQLQFLSVLQGVNSTVIVFSL